MIGSSSNILNFVPILCLIFNRYIFTGKAEYGQWGEYSKCSKSCEIGSKSRRRQCIVPKSLQGVEDCSRLGPDVQTVACNTQPCPGMLLIHIIQLHVFFIRNCL